MLADFYEVVPGFDATLDHPELGPTLFVVLEHCSGSMWILRTLLEMEMSANRIATSRSDLFGSGQELVTPLLWALA